MFKVTEKMFETVPHGYFTSQEVAALFPGSQDRRYGLVKRAIAHGEMIPVRRGLYCLAPKYCRQKINLFALAGHLYGPSYISLQSALSWHGWIPEAVYTLTSVSAGKAKEFTTPLGLFSYIRVPQKVFYAGVQRVVDDTGNVLFMASPLKALADYVYVHKKNWANLEPAAQSLRMDGDEFESVTAADINELLENYTNRRVLKFLNGLKRDLMR